MPIHKISKDEVFMTYQSNYSLVYYKVMEKYVKSNVNLVVIRQMSMCI